mmetsp:Transcript_58387/g.161528  ORF Transcript_58387/g.161528 Transcript_58387/m.161528 type:complete len:266 (-) Transcript_58387:393-1190(-)|eukprot:CAMPEP_0179081486 /NCGR_PEP_ID=MMETSP0796-20121207/36691_1 /TAXON_ID=73915 /ORGANISM="Pyrodinium bahamense, Strain pbaha01" /LENGTH=265 /DNA_ID=CAMNT_0020778871 /DNA_START=568 /DNA_END=1365 /DNA_ORIENTATION=+
MSSEALSAWEIRPNVNPTPKCPKLVAKKQLLCARDRLQISHRWVQDEDSMSSVPSSLLVFIEPRSLCCWLGETVLRKVESSGGIVVATEAKGPIGAERDGPRGLLRAVRALDWLGGEKAQEGVILLLVRRAEGDEVVGLLGHGRTQDIVAPFWAIASLGASVEEAEISFRFLVPHWPEPVLIEVPVCNQAQMLASFHTNGAQHVCLELIPRMAPIQRINLQQHVFVEGPIVHQLAVHLQNPREHKGIDGLPDLVVTADLAQAAGP